MPEGGKLGLDLSSVRVRAIVFHCPTIGSHVREKNTGKPETESREGGVTKPTWACSVLRQERHEKRRMPEQTRGGGKKMGLSVPVLSLIALFIAIVVSCTTSLNIGTLAIGLSLIAGHYLGGVKIPDMYHPLSSWPLSAVICDEKQRWLPPRGLSLSCYEKYTNG